MDRFDRVFQLHKILSNRRTPISRLELQQRLDCSRATVARLIEDAKNHLNAPIRYDRERNGYYYDPEAREMYELPGLWLNPSELFALLVSEKLLSDVQPGLLAPTLAPLRSRIVEILRHRRLGHPEMERRIRILQSAARQANVDQFQMVATALLDRKQLHIFYRGRARDEFTERDVSPQRLTYYRDNWYLDAWCHLRKGLRSFSLDRMQPRYIGDEPARDIPEEVLDAHFTASYGIFAGAGDKTAILRFSSSAAKWVADEQWHRDQQSRALPDGRYELRIPYSDPTELMMDILKYGEEVEVAAPAALRRAVARRLRAAADLYRTVDIGRRTS